MPENLEEYDNMSSYGHAMGIVFINSKQHCYLHKLYASLGPSAFVYECGVAHETSPLYKELLAVDCCHEGREFYFV